MEDSKYDLVSDSSMPLKSDTLLQTFMSKHNGHSAKKFGT